MTSQIPENHICGCYIQKNIYRGIPSKVSVVPHRLGLSYTRWPTLSKCLQKILPLRKWTDRKSLIRPIYIQRKRDRLDLENRQRIVQKTLSTVVTFGLFMLQLFGLERVWRTWLWKQAWDQTATGNRVHVASDWLQDTNTTEITLVFRPSDSHWEPR